MDETFYLALHAPVLELHFTELVGTHNGPVLGPCPNGINIVLSPALHQGASACLLRLKDGGVLLSLVVPPRYSVPHNVQQVCSTSFSPFCGIYYSYNFYTNSKIDLSKVHNRRSLTNNPVAKVGAIKVEDILLVSTITEVNCLDLQGELFYEGTTVDGLGVGVGIPGLLLNP